MSQTTQPNGVEATYKNAVARSINAAALKADDARDDCPHAPIDHASQAALENSPLTGRRFETAYSEVFATTRYAVNADGDTAAVLERVHDELLRVTFEN